MNNTVIKSRQLNMSKLGLGTWPMVGDDCTRAVLQALELGYRHVDTAAAYQNEDAVGRALVETDVPREEIHVTSKVWWDKLAPEDMRQSFDNTLRALQSEYVDLFLIHWPGKGCDLARSVETLVSLKEQGRARNIGVANFPLELRSQIVKGRGAPLLLLRQIVEGMGAPLAAIQVEYHVTLGQRNLLQFAREHEMALTAYSPLMRNKAHEIPELLRIAEKHGVLPTQVALKWLLDQPNVAAIPKASSRKNQSSNLASFNVQL